MRVAEPSALDEWQVSEMLAPAPEPARPAASAPTVRLPVQDALIRELPTAEALYARGRYGDAAATLRAVLPARATAPEHLRALALLTRALANQGALDEALYTSERWIAADKLDAAAHYLHAMVLQELGERSRARGALLRAVYLQPEFPLAHFALGHHARAEARVGEAQRHFDNAARQLAGLAADEPVPESEGMTAGRLREIIVALGRDP